MDNEIQLGVVLPSAGLGLRLPSNIKKQYRKINGKEILVHTLSNVLNVKYLKEVIIVVSKDDIAEIKKIITQYYPAQMNMINFIEGGTTRQKSVLNGLCALSDYINIVAIHDAVRPFASTALFDKTVMAASISGAAIPVLPINETIKYVENKLIEKTINRNNIYTAQTPQVFKKDIIKSAHTVAELNNFECTDESQVAELAGVAISTVQGDEYNFKITTVADIAFAEYLIASGFIKK